MALMKQLITSSVAYIHIKLSHIPALWHHCIKKQLKSLFHIP